MTDYNYFDLLKLKPFPMLPPKEEIEDAIRKWQRDTEKMANSAGTPEDRRRELREMLRTLPPLLMAFAGDAKAQRVHRIEFRELHCTQLMSTAGYMKIYSGTQIQEVTLRYIARQQGLATDDVIKVFKDTGFEILKKQMKQSVLPKASDLAVIDENLARLREGLARGVGNIPKNIRSVENLYEYLEVMLGPDEFKAVNTNDFKSLQAQFNSLSVAHARGTEPYKYYRNIESKAKITFFGNAQSKARYDLYVRLQSRGLNDALMALRVLPQAMLIDEEFMQNWIFSIQEELGVCAEDACQIYYEVCDIRPDYYRSMEFSAPVTVTCDCCRYRNTFASLTTAIQARCSLCGTPLYRQDDSSDKQSATKPPLPDEADGAPDNSSETQLPDWFPHTEDPMWFSDEADGTPNNATVKQGSE